MKTQIQITLDANGDFNLEVLNGQGQECTKLTAPFEQAFGGVDPDKRRFKPEYHANKQNRVNHGRAIN